MQVAGLTSRLLAPSLNFESAFLPGNHDCYLCEGFMKEAIAEFFAETYARENLSCLGCTQEQTNEAFKKSYEANLDGFKKLLNDGNGTIAKSRASALAAFIAQKANREMTIDPNEPALIDQDTFMPKSGWSPGLNGNTMTVAKYIEIILAQNK